MRVIYLNMNSDALKNHGDSLPHPDAHRAQRVAAAGDFVAAALRQDNEAARAARCRSFLVKIFMLKTAGSS
jgi:hypothetical protein